MPIDTTGNARIDGAAAEIAVSLRDAGYGTHDQDRYDEAQRLRDEIILGTLAMAGVLPLWRPATNGASKRRWFLIRDESVPLAHRYHYSPRGQLTRYASFDTAQRAADKLNEVKQ